MPIVGTWFLKIFISFSAKKILHMIIEDEKRLVPRTKIKWSVIIQSSQGTINTEAHNISVEGAFIRSLNPPALGEVFKMFIKVPNLDRPLSVDAQVVWSSRREPDAVVALIGIGVKFTQITGRDRNLLNEVISTHLYGGAMLKKLNICNNFILPSLFAWLYSQSKTYPTDG